MLNYLIHEILLNQLVIGFTFYKLFRKTIYPMIDKWLDREGGKFRTSVQRKIAIWNHYWTMHPNQSVINCNKDHCSSI